MMSLHPIAKLRWQTQSGETEYLLKPEESLTIGREPDNTIIVNDSMVSRHHARIDWASESYTIQDLDSRNGTFVNGRRVRRRRRLSDGDEITLYQFRLSFETLRVEEVEPDSGDTLVAMPLPGQPKLIVTSGPDAGREILLNEDIMTIGRISKSARWPSSQILLDDRAVSRPHACIQREETGFSIVDLESANGTMVNGQPISGPHPLTDGDVIGMGETRLVFRIGS